MQTNLLNKIKTVLKNNNIFFSNIPIAYGNRLRLVTGAIITVYYTNKYIIQGKNTEYIYKILKENL